MENSKDKIKTLEEKIKILESQLKELKKKLETHRHDGHGYSI